jgi:hypothetical protein
MDLWRFRHGNSTLRSDRSGRRAKLMSARRAILYDLLDRIERMAIPLWLVDHPGGDFR